MRLLCSMMLVLLATLGWGAEARSAAVEVFTLTDGRTLTGTYDEAAQAITLSGPMAATIKVAPNQIAKRAPAAAAAATPAASPEGAAAVIPSSQVDPTVLAPLTAPGVPWVDGDRLLLVGDLLAAPGQQELALRVHEALAGLSDRRIEVFSLQNHGIPVDKWAGALRDELALRPASVVVVMVGVGDVLAVMPEPPKPVPGAKPAAKPATPPPPLALPSVEQWRKQLTDMVTLIQSSGAVAVLCTPAIVGDKPNDGPGAIELDAYAAAVRAVANEAKAGLADLRAPLLERLLARNPKGTREQGILSKSPGRLRPEAMDLCAGLIVREIAAAVPRIPWSVRVPGGVFTGTTTVEVQVDRIADDQVQLFVTMDGSEPTVRSPPWSGSLVIKDNTHVRVLAVAKDGGAQRQADAWYLLPTSRAADQPPATTLPGLAVTHAPVGDWGAGEPPIPAAGADLHTWWPNTDLEVLSRMPAGRRPAKLACLRHAGWFIAPVDGTYIFSLAADGDARLVIGDRVVARIDARGRETEHRGAITLAQGYHPIATFYGGASSAPTLTLRVGMPGQRLRAIPDMLLRRAPPSAGVEMVEPEPASASAWRLNMNDTVFAGSTKAEIGATGIPIGDLRITFTTDGSEPTDQSEPYVKPIPIGSTTRIRARAYARADPNSVVTASAWYMETRKHAADAPSVPLQPGLWVEHCTLKQWTDPISSIDTQRADFTTRWPTVELMAYGQVPVHRWPDLLFGLRFTGWFHAPVDGTYVFATDSDDATRIIMGTVAVLKNDDLHPERWQQEAVELTRGWHQFTMLYGQGPGVTKLDVHVGLAGQRLQRLADLLVWSSPTAPQRKGLVGEPSADDEP